jgi:hypothetical protein
VDVAPLALNGVIVEQPFGPDGFVQPVHGPHEKPDGEGVTVREVLETGQGMLRKQMYVDFTSPAERSRAGGGEAGTSLAGWFASWNGPRGRFSRTSVSSWPIPGYIRRRW